MGHLKRTMMVLSVAILLSSACLECAWAARYGDQAVGPIIATVVRRDDRSGLTVRSAPTNTARILGYLSMGSSVRTYREFHNGWAKIKTPINGGWAPIGYLEPVRARAVVVSVDRPENCLRIRSGPGASYQLVGCARAGETLRLTGIWSQGNWAEIETPVQGWVNAAQIRADLPPERPVRRPAYVYRSRPPARTYVYYQTIRVPTYVYSRYPRYYRGYRPYRYYTPGVGVAVGPRGVRVRAGGVAVGVSPRGGVRVRVR